MVFLVLLSLLALSSSFELPEAVDSKIVGGKVITYDQAPYQASLIYINSHICGGSVLNRRNVLTAAHCTFNMDASQLSVIIGTDDLTKGGTRIKVMRYLMHPKYEPKTFDYDYSILFIEFSIFPKNVVYALLPSPKDKLKNGDMMFISGWGETKVASDNKFLLRGATVPIVSMASCKKSYGTGKITTRMICAGYKLGGIDTCQGDSGGPLVRVSDKVLVGVVSWGQGCALPNFPGIYSKVSYVVKWILQNIPEFG